MDWTESQINDDHVFPVTSDIPFPRNFQSSVRKILTRLFRVFVHVYIHHFDRIGNDIFMKHICKYMNNL